MPLPAPFDMIKNPHLQMWVLLGIAASDTIKVTSFLSAIMLLELPEMRLVEID